MNIKSREVICGSRFRAIGAAIVLFMSIATSVAAGPLEDARAAYDRADYAIALRLYRAIADQGNGNGQFGLGTIYATGHGAAQDYVEAAKWYRLAADQGHAQAQFNLGTMYDSGRGVPKDEVAAHMWLSLSASEGVQEAAKARDILARRMTQEQLSEAKKLANEWRPN